MAKCYMRLEDQKSESQSQCHQLCEHTTSCHDPKTTYANSGGALELGRLMALPGASLTRMVGVCHSVEIASLQ